MSTGMSPLVFFAVVFSLFILHTLGAGNNRTAVVQNSSSTFSSSSTSSTFSSTSSSSSYYYSSSSSSSSSSKYFNHDQLNIVEKEGLVTFFKNVSHSCGCLNWNQSEPACTWSGVTCNPSGITVLYLSLPASHLVGEIPPNTIGRLTSLRVLSLSYNNLSGEIPSDFSNLADLRTVYLNNNNFSGNIPSAFSNLPYLTRLLLNNNRFSGELPVIINADRLTYFNVSYNKLVGRIPRSLSMFPESAFSNNSYLCGRPLSESCNTSYPATKSDDEERDNTTSTGRRAIFGIYSGSTMLLLILLSSLGKNMYQHMMKQPTKSSELTKRILRLFGDDHAFDFDDLLKTTAEGLGEGSDGTVSYKLVLAGKNKTVVVKILKDVVVPEKEFTETMEVLGKINNEYVVPLRAFYNYSLNQKLLVYDYMPAGSLSARLHGSGRTQLDWDRRMKIALDAAKGLAYLHELPEKVVHGNIKSSNILLRQETNNEASVSDYGVSKLFGGLSPLNNCYWAPEVLEAQKVTSKSDVYSFGVLLLELLTGKIPEQATSGEPSKWVVSLVREEPKAEMFDVELTRGHNIEKMVQLWHIAKDCVSIDPDKRPKMHQVVISMIENMCLRPSSDDYSKGYDFTPSTGTRDTPSTITP